MIIALQLTYSFLEFDQVVVLDSVSIPKYPDRGHESVAPHLIKKNIKYFIIINRFLNQNLPSTLSWQWKKHSATQQSLQGKNVAE